MEAERKEAKSEYELQAEEFLSKHGIRFKATYLSNELYFEGDTEARDVYRMFLARKGKTTSFRFGQSVHNSQRNIKPTAYDVLASITKYDPGSHEEFCGNYGYDVDSIQGLKTYRGVVKEWEKVQRFFTAAELEELQEIN
jgi:hypothetical protein